MRSKNGNKTNKTLSNCHHFGTFIGDENDSFQIVIRNYAVSAHVQRQVNEHGCRIGTSRSSKYSTSTNTVQIAHVK